MFHPKYVTKVGLGNMLTMSALGGDPSTREVEAKDQEVNLLLNFKTSLCYTKHCQRWGGEAKSPECMVIVER